VRDRTPSYNLKVIVRETGIKPDTLRAWERRYNLPAPERTAGGHRLYSQRDLETIKWLLARQEEGLSISNAAQLWREIEAAGRDPLQAAAVPSPAQEAVTGKDDLAALADAWLRACLAFDEGAAEQQLDLAQGRYAPEQICLELIQKAVVEVGRLWYENKASVQQEHFVSAMAVRRLNTLLAAAPAPSLNRLILLACAPQEEHTISSLLLTLLLRYRGWPVAYLGANVPLERMEKTLQATEPALVLLTAQTLATAAEALAAANFFQAHGASVAYGGAIFNRLPLLRAQMPGYFLGETLAEATANTAAILTTAAPAAAGRPLARQQRETLACFEQQHRLLEARVWQRLRATGLPENHLRTANLHLAQNIRAALTFGDVSLVNHEISWVRQLLANYGVPDQLLGHYLAIYHETAREHLGPRCQPIIEWLAEVSASQR
jgi:MerR family transcriptional regulator, light-induced transcriptional regulator